MSVIFYGMTSAEQDYIAGQDCLKVLERQGTNSIHHVIMDPPYGTGDDWAINSKSEMQSEIDRMVAYTDNYVLDPQNIGDLKNYLTEFFTQYDDHHHYTIKAFKRIEHLIDSIIIDYEGDPVRQGFAINLMIPRILQIHRVISGNMIFFCDTKCQVLLNRICRAIFGKEAEYNKVWEYAPENKQHRKPDDEVTDSHENFDLIFGYQKTNIKTYNYERPHWSELTKQTKKQRSSGFKTVAIHGNYTIVFNKNPEAIVKMIDPLVHGINMDFPDKHEKIIEDHEWYDHIDVNEQWPKIDRWLKQKTNEMRYTPEKINISFAYDPIEEYTGGNLGSIYKYAVDSKNPYPTSKPVPLIGLLLRQFTNPDDIVLDPFTGSGTLMRANDQLDPKQRRRAFGIDAGSLGKIMYNNYCIDIGKFNSTVSKHEIPFAYNMDYLRRLRASRQRLDIENIVILNYCHAWHNSNNGKRHDGYWTTGDNQKVIIQVTTQSPIKQSKIDEVAAAIELNDAHSAVLVYLDDVDLKKIQRDDIANRKGKIQAISLESIHREKMKDGNHDKSEFDILTSLLDLPEIDTISVNDQIKKMANKRRHKPPDPEPDLFDVGGIKKV